LKANTRSVSHHTQPPSTTCTGMNPFSNDEEYATYNKSQVEARLAARLERQRKVGLSFGDIDSCGSIRMRPNMYLVIRGSYTGWMGWHHRRNPDFTITLSDHPSNPSNFIDVDPDDLDWVDDVLADEDHMHAKRVRVRELEQELSELKERIANYDAGRDDTPLAKLIHHDVGRKRPREAV